MRKGWLIYREQDARKNKSYIDWFIQEAFSQNVSLELIIRETLTIGIFNNERVIYLKNKVVTKPDFAVVRTIEPLLSMHLESSGVAVFNSSTIAHICNNKALTHHHMTDLSIPMVDTVFLKREDLTDQPPMPYPFVLIESAGRSGKQVYLIESPTDWLYYKMQLSMEDIIIQNCAVQLGKDLRVFIVGQEIIGAVLRESTRDFRANFTLGGSARWYELNEAERRMIQKITTHFDFGMVGIDFLVGTDGRLLFNEIEDIVGSRTLSAVCDINIVQKYITHIKRHLSH